MSSQEVTLTQRKHLPDKCRNRFSAAQVQDILNDHSYFQRNHHGLAVNCEVFSFENQDILKFNEQQPSEIMCNGLEKLYNGITELCAVIMFILTELVTVCFG